MGIQKTMPRVIVAIALLTTLLVSSCITDTLQHQYQHINKNGWAKNDTIDFDIPPATQSGRYSIKTEIRCLSNFPLHHIYIVRHFSFDPPFIGYTDTLCINTDRKCPDTERSGVNTISYAKTDSSLVLAKGQKGRVKMHHIMQKENIPHVLDLGIRIKYLN